jgi:hypothetical protein
MHVRSSGCKERKRAHPNMVSVQNQSRESSFIDLLEVDVGWSTLASALFSLGWIAFQIFPSLTSSSEKKV